MILFRYLKLLYVQVLIGIALGVAVGFWGVELGALAGLPAGKNLGVELKPLADGFIALIKMIIAPVVFVTVASGIAHMGDMKKFGRVGIKALVYFEVVSTLALLIGLAVGNLLQPGAGFHGAASAKDIASITEAAEKAHDMTIVKFLLDIIPTSFFTPFAEGALLQVLLIAILTGFACTRLGAFGARVAHFLDDAGKVFFSIIGIIVRLAPIGAFGAMAYTIGKFGLGVLVNLGFLIGCFYVTAALFVVVVLGLIARVVGFNIFRFIAYIRDELLIVLGTSSSESVLPQIMQKLQRLGASRSVTGLVIPTGYSFNLDGTNIYMTLAILFLAQASGVHLDLGEQLAIVGVAMLTSKGASGVTGAGFITLAATLAIVPDIPMLSLALIVGIDRFMSECRALTNLVGNGVATLAVARWEGELDRERLGEELKRGPRAHTDVEMDDLLAVGGKAD
ncbi:MAG: C4-dicarboxylate transporter DctA [Caulobacteraceae bacterium]|nr:C4-dicarboxylate transporter DctA [Caulobacteraceae bacterium]